MDILLNGNVIEELSTIVHAKKALEHAKHLTVKLLNIIPKQQFQVAIQAAVGGKILARETIKAYRKDITGKLVIFSFIIHMMLILWDLQLYLLMF